MDTRFANFRKKAQAAGAALLLCSVCAVPSVHAQSAPVGQQVPLEAVGEFAQIETQSTLSTMKALQSSDAQVQGAALEKVLAQPGQFTPPVLYVASRVLMQQGRKDEAAFWFYAGQLRARYDANRSADRSVHDAVGRLNASFGPEINAYAMQDLDKFQNTVQSVLAWERDTPHDYDHRWINLSGMQAIQASLNPGSAQAPLSQPREQWPSIAERTQREYAEGFAQALEQLRSRK